MKRFLHAHATHPDVHGALALAAAQIEAQRGSGGRAVQPTLGWVYLTDHYAAKAEALLDELRQRWPGVAWVGAVGVGISASGVEYFDEPALALMLAELPREQFRVYSGVRPLGDFAAHTALVHADPSSADLPELIAEQSRRTATGYLFGGLASARTRTLHIAEQVLQGGLSGVAFGSEIEIVSRVTQGCQPVGPLHQVTASERNLVTTLDGEPALACLLRDLKLADSADPRQALPRLRQTLVGLSDAPEAQRKGDGAATPRWRGAFGPDTRVRHLVGLDPARSAVAVGDMVEPGMQLAFCSRDTEAARRDLVRICAEIREEVEPEMLTPASALALRDGDPGEAGAAGHGIAGALYVSCTGRGGPHFGAPSAELAIVKHALGDVPLVGFFAAGEIGHHHLYGYTGVLTVFRA